MAPEVAALDRALARVGETITLRRPVPNAAPIDVQCRAMVRRADPMQVVDVIQATDSVVILSPTEMAQAQWPGPPVRGDRAIIRGDDRMVREVETVNVRGEAVRYQLHVTG